MSAAKVLVCALAEVSLGAFSFAPDAGGAKCAVARPPCKAKAAVQTSATNRPIRALDELRLVEFISTAEKHEGPN
jgi:hypothetical protein